MRSPCVPSSQSSGPPSQGVKLVSSVTAHARPGSSRSVIGAKRWSCSALDSSAPRPPADPHARREGRGARAYAVIAYVSRLRPSGAASNVPMHPRSALCPPRDTSFHVTNTGTSRSGAASPLLRPSASELRDDADDAPDSTVDDDDADGASDDDADDGVPLCSRDTASGCGRRGGAADASLPTSAPPSPPACAPPASLAWYCAQSSSQRASGTAWRFSSCAVSTSKQNKQCAVDAMLAEAVAVGSACVRGCAATRLC